MYNNKSHLAWMRLVPTISIMKYVKVLIITTIFKHSS